MIISTIFSRQSKFIDWKVWQVTATQQTKTSERRSTMVWSTFTPERTSGGSRSQCMLVNVTRLNRDRAPRPGTRTRPATSSAVWRTLMMVRTSLWIPNVASSDYVYDNTHSLVFLIVDKTTMLCVLASNINFSLKSVGIMVLTKISASNHCNLSEYFPCQKVTLKKKGRGPWRIKMRTSLIHL